MGAQRVFGPKERKKRDKRKKEEKEMGGKWKHTYSLSYFLFLIIKPVNKRRLTMTLDKFSYGEDLRS